MKTILSLILCFALTGCLSLRTTSATTKPGLFARVGTSISTWWGAHKGQVGQTALLAGKDLSLFVADALLNASKSPQDASNKADGADTLAYAIRIADKSQLVSADKFKAYLDIWTPSTASHWNTVTSEIASAALSGPPTAQRLEALAMRVNQAASTVRDTNNP